MCLVTQLCPTLCEPMDCIPPGSSVHGISQARIMEWGAISSSRGSPNPGIEPASPVSPALQTDSLPSEPSGKPFTMYTSIKWCIWSDIYNHQSNDDWFDIYISNHYNAHFKCLKILFDNYTSMKLKRKKRASCGTVVKSLDPAKLIVNQSCNCFPLWGQIYLTLKRYCNKWN